MGFNYGTRHLSGTQKAIISERERNDKRLREESAKKKEALKQAEEVTEIEIIEDKK